MEQKINLDKFLGDLREELYNRNMWLLIEVIDAALKQQHIGIYDGIVVEEKEEKRPDTIKFEEEPTKSEGQKDQVEIFYCTPPEKFPPLLKAEHYMLLYKDFERLLGMIHKKVSSLPEHKVDAYFSWLQTELSKRAKHHQEEARLLEDFHSFYRVPKPEI